MSADNIIYVIPFRRADNVVVHRVCEVRLSSQDDELLEAMQRGKYKEFEGKHSDQQAYGYALILERELQIVEYGISTSDTVVDIEYFIKRLADCNN